MTTWKPYIYNNREYGEIYRKGESFEDGLNRTGGGEYSEFAKPYKANNPYDDTYQSYEWTWPDDDWDFDFPPDSWDPPGGDTPCDIGPECEWIKIVGPDSVDGCDREYEYSVNLYVTGCYIPWYAGNVQWEAAGCEIVDSFGPWCTVRFPETEGGGTATLTATGFDGCSDTIKIEYDCLMGCCDDITISGPTTTTQPSSGNTKDLVYSLSPPCPEASVNGSGTGVVSTTLSSSGGSVTIVIDDTACGTITLTVDPPDTDEEGNACENNTTKTYNTRVTDSGGWAGITDHVEDCNDCCGCMGATQKGGACVSGGLCYWMRHSDGAAWLDASHCNCLTPHCLTKDPQTNSGCSTPCSSVSAPTCACASGHTVWKCGTYTTSCNTAAGAGGSPIGKE